MKSKAWIRFIALLLLLSLVLVACGGDDEAADDTAADPTAETADDADEAADDTTDDMADEAADEMDGMSGEIRFMIYGDGNEPDAMQALVDQFMAENPGATVILDVVPYSTIDEQLQVLVETGEGPDIARITGYTRYRGYYLDLRPYLSDPGYFESNFNPIPLAAMREPGDTTGLYGFPDSFTVTGPYVNKTLFEQAGIEMPGPDATWADWTETTTAVAEATGVDYAISVDSTGHRIAGPAISNGAQILAADGTWTIDSPGMRDYVDVLKGWHDDDITPAGVWLGEAPVGSCIDDFKSANLVMCMSGSWQINGLAADVGDAFDWAVVPNPSGPGGSTGLPGGAGIAAFADTEYPELVAAFMEFLVQEDNYRQYSAQTLLLPGHIGVASSAVPFETDNESVLNALNAYTAEVPKLEDQGFLITYNPFAFAYFRNAKTRISQYIVGELTLDEALAAWQQDIDDAIAEAGAPAVAEEEPAEAVTGEIRFMIYGDGNEPDAMQVLVDQFMAENPGATVILDVVPYSTIDEQLQVLVETGEGPDIARITGYTRYRGYYLDLRPYLSDPGYFESNFNPIPLAAMREPGDTTGLYGFPDSFTVTGPYVNMTLFEQAGIEMPGPDATWADWTETTTAVAEATGVDYAISVDSTGHRIAGPAISDGAQILAADGTWTIDSPGMRDYVDVLKGWHDDDITPAGVWLGEAPVGSCIDDFKSANLVMCMSGSWQINGLAADVGDAFDWAVVPNPSGPGGSTGLPGGAGIAAFADTEYPELVAAFMEFLVQEDNYRQYSAQTLLLPGHIGVASSAVPFETDNESVLNALNAYTAEVPKLEDQGFLITYNPFAFAYFRNAKTRISQYIVGELTLDEALAAWQQDIDDAIAEAGG